MTDGREAPRRGRGEHADTLERGQAVKRKRPGCECPFRWSDGTRTDASDRCDAQWIRCNAALKMHHEQRVEVARNIVEGAKENSDE